MRVYFVRHGQTKNNQLGDNGILGGNAPLNRTGKAQAENAAALLYRLNVRPDLIATSHFKRAQQTAHIIARKLGLEYSIHSELGEIEYGEWDGRIIQEALEIWKPLSKDEIVDFKLAPGNESWRDLAKRMGNAVRSFQEKGLNEIIIVSHGAPIRFAIAGLVDNDPESWHSMHARYDNAHVSCLEFKAGKWHTAFLNKA